MILRKYRRKGIGHAAAKKAFELYHADWKVVQMANNTPAISFWRKVIGDFTDNKYIETFRSDTMKYIQEFTTKGG
ncbi:GNAT family N-acetyltransferase [Paenibacillus sp. SAF-054]|uniref:GNAT family N-acetyltransferase n=1 Tax=unclassified Paenibacillus TaxID=185978 RepID=UPI003F7FC31A